MSQKSIAKRAVIITAILAAIGEAINTTPSVVIQLLAFGSVVLVSSLALFVLFRSPWLRAIPEELQKQRIWLTTGVIGLMGWACSGFRKCSRQVKQG